jgi:hypothetical protein
MMVVVVVVPKGGMTGMKICLCGIVIATVDTHLNGWTSNHCIPMTERTSFHVIYVRNILCIN